MGGWNKITEATAESYLRKKSKQNKNGCWIWIGLIGKDGYGIAGPLGYWYAHQLSYFVFKGKIPKGKQVCHNCPHKDNKACINPEHLVALTAKQHGRDRTLKNQMHKGEEHGVISHPPYMKLQTGEKHWTHRHPEWIARGSKHGSKTHPQNFKGSGVIRSPKTQGKKHWTHKLKRLSHMTKMSKKGAKK